MRFPIVSTRETLQAILAARTLGKERLLSQGKLATLSIVRLSPIQKAIKQVGGISALAARLGVSYQAIQQWEKSGRIPAERVLEVEKATEGLVTRHQLRPDLYPSEARAA